MAEQEQLESRVGSIDPGVKLFVAIAAKGRSSLLRELPFAELVLTR